MSDEVTCPEVDRWVVHHIAHGQCVRCGTRYGMIDTARDDTYEMAAGLRIEDGGPVFAFDLRYVPDGVQCDPSAPWPPPIRVLLHHRHVERDGAIGDRRTMDGDVIVGFEHAWDGEDLVRYVD